MPADYHFVTRWRVEGTRPLFSANHRWAMARGEESLRLELARRRSPTHDAAARVPAPPRPTFRRLVRGSGKQRR